MRILLPGATGMVGQGVLRECLLARDVEQVVAPVRRPLPHASPKLIQEPRNSFYDWSDFDLTGIDACFFCLGVSVVGKAEAEYRQLTYDLTLALANALVAASPQAVFVYVSGRGTDAAGRSMWARVKGATENALIALPFRGVYAFRPGYIQPLHGIRSKVWWYQAVYDALGWGYPLMQRLAPNTVTTTDAVAKAMLHVVRHGWPNHLLETADINRAAADQAD